jgi:hypothetical protein
MADDTNLSSKQGRPGEATRGDRPSGGRDLGGFRIRLSDNEMQAARALQEAFQLRSTVAVLGFSLRTLAQMLEAGQLDALVAQQREQGAGRSSAPRPDRGGARGGERPDRRGERGPDRDRVGEPRQARPNPFARPARPAPAAAIGEVAEASPPPAAAEDPDAAVDSSGVESPGSDTFNAADVSAVEQASGAAISEVSGEAQAQAAPETPAS